MKKNQVGENSVGRLKGGDAMDRKILFVDDEKVILDMLERVFDKAGYTVHCAESAERALEVMGRENIQVIFLDLTLPGMNGVDLFRQIQRHKPTAIVYALTAYTTLFELEDCRQAGFDDYFAKPIDLKTLHKAAEDAFEKLERWEKISNRKHEERDEK